MNVAARHGTGRAAHPRAAEAARAQAHAQASIRIALRQVKASGGPSPALTGWFAAHDTGAADDPDELDGGGGV